MISFLSLILWTIDFIYCNILYKQINLWGIVMTGLEWENFKKLNSEEYTIDKNKQFINFQP